ncbi:putative leucine-rich repeat receptor-like serine/threonine-protein kinase At2g14440 isoform X1 [Cryptomeria japonica]|uniref:putative leucine-rich repeat receptor-like serine/threonine-protein kinase At2g14440 isoform X1 n=1 Tax=Cryptomeria japonica TaxID=3369 RepID=UPI0027DA3411|nr:putative leucine-rich repeat receptor-like serine/threonine-protein kinase At2g14440 isoform X1 [Cryptomeria japonica]
MKFRSLTMLAIMSFIVLFISRIHSNPDGFLSIRCGASINRTDDQDRLWISDTPFTRIRSNYSIDDPSLSVPASTDWNRKIFAYFTDLTVNKYCYLIPVKPGILYLVRVTFYKGAFETPIPLASVFDLLINGIKWAKVNLTLIQAKDFLNQDIMLTAKSNSISLCLARNSETGKENFVFISTIASRQLNSALYSSIDFHNNALVLLDRRNLGSINSYAYPQDDFDRWWYGTSTSSVYDNINTTENISGKGLLNQPPLDVLQTAITMEAVGNLLATLQLPSSVYEGGSCYFALYFCNIKAENLSVTNRFQVFINDNRITDWLQFTSFLQCLVVQRNLEFEGTGSVNITLHPGEGSDVGPFINAAEAFQIKDVQNMTHPEDVMTIRTIASSINVPDDWFGGDPCLPAGYACTGIICNGDNPSRVIILNLTNFGLSGNIPPIIGRLGALTRLLLGSNNLSGSIPDFSSLKNLTTLQLQNNQLTGEIPASLEKLPLLNQLYLENNKLDGTVPSGLNKPGLDFRLTPQSNFPTGNKSHKIRNLILGCVVGATLIALVLVTFLWKYLRRPRAHITESQIMPPEETDGVEEGHAKEYHRLAIEYTEEEIKAATNNYSTVIGVGGFGSVFFGTLSGYNVAVKILSSTSNQGQQEFQNEVTLLCRLYHKNLISLIGYSKQTVEALVYEYMDCGTLKDHLHGKAKEEKPLDWNTRLNIALQAAEGLLYLHQGCNPPIIHRDIKCTNILLDARMNAKVADFGLAKLLDRSQTYVSTAVKGTIGYLDPEYFETASLTAKSDVYSFGVVLLEIISGKSTSENILPLARELLSCGRIADLMDSSLDGHYKLSSAWKVAEVAYACVAQKSIDRPPMSTVVEVLKETVALEIDDIGQYAHIPDTTFPVSDVMPTAR